MARYDTLTLLSLAKPTLIPFNSDQKSAINGAITVAEHQYYLRNTRNLTSAPSSLSIRQSRGDGPFRRLLLPSAEVDCRHWLKKRPESVIAVVSHSGFLRLAVTFAQYPNADYRVFDFADDDSDRLIERETTKESGGGMGEGRFKFAPQTSSPWRKQLERSRLERSPKGIRLAFDGSTDR